jgi:hypothetical protein
LRFVLTKPVFFVENVHRPATHRALRGKRLGYLSWGKIRREGGAICEMASGWRRVRKVDLESMG